MKTTELQKKIIDICITELRCWKNSNDINSPTHSSDGETALLELYYDDELYSDDCEIINTALQNLRHTILKVTKQYENNRTD